MSKILIDEATVKLALEALELSHPRFGIGTAIYIKAITAINEALAQPEQEPVAVWELFEDGWDSIADPEWMETLPVGTKLYTTPPQRKPLTDEEILAVARDHYSPHQRPEISFARAIEAAHGIKENT